MEDIGLDLGPEVPWLEGKAEPAVGTLQIDWVVVEAAVAAAVVEHFGIEVAVVASFAVVEAVVFEAVEAAAAVVAALFDLAVRQPSPLDLVVHRQPLVVVAAAVVADWLAFA